MSILKKEWLIRGTLILSFTLVIIALFGVYYYDPTGSYYLNAYEVNESTAQQGIIIHLTEQDLKEHPVLAEVIKEDENFERLLRRDGVITNNKESQIIRNKFSWNETTKMKFIEYNGKYYEINIMVS